MRYLKRTKDFMLTYRRLDNLEIFGYSCNDPYQIIQVFNKFDQPIVGGAKLTFSSMNNFLLTKTPFRRPRRYEFTDRLNVKIRLTDKKLWP